MVAVATGAISYCRVTILPFLKSIIIPLYTVVDAASFRSILFVICPGAIVIIVQESDYIVVEYGIEEDSDDIQFRVIIAT